MKNLAKQTSLKAVALSVLLLMAILPMRAQWYIGLGGTAMMEKNPFVGELQENTYLQKNPDRSILVNLQPQVGYRWNGHWAVGTYFNVDTYWYLYKFAEFNQWVNYFNCSFNPYLRYTIRLSERLSFQTDAFLDLGLSNDDPRFTGWGIGLRPGLQYDLCKHFILQANIGFLGLYSKKDNVSSGLDIASEQSGKEANISGGFDFTPKQWSLSLIYVFSKKAAE